MEHVKRPVCIVLFLCGVTLACTTENPKATDWRGTEPLDRARIREELRQIRQARDPMSEWNADIVTAALDRNDTAALTKIVRQFPADAARMFEKSDLHDHARARRFATALAAAGEHYPMAVVEALERPRDAKALEQGLGAFHDKDYLHAATLLQSAGNPLHIAARYYAAATDWKISTLDPALPYLKPQYRELSCRIYTWHANLLEFDDRLLEAHADYDRALAFAKGDPTNTAGTLSRRSLNYSILGNGEAALRYARAAMSLLPYVADTNARNAAFAAAAMAARQLRDPRVALEYQNAAVEDVERVVAVAEGETLIGAKKELVAALRTRAEILVELNENAAATADLDKAAELADAVENDRDRNLFRMRIREVEAQTAPPAKGVILFTEALELAKDLDSTYRAMLHFKRAAVQRNLDNAKADADIAAAMQLLRNEVRNSLAANPEAVSQLLWEPYFSRFQDKYAELIESRITAGDAEGAFVYDELARAFEPMQILLQSKSAPPDFRPIETVADFQRARASLPEDTVILQYLVLEDKTYTWVVTRERVVVVQQRATRDEVAKWVQLTNDSQIRKQPDKLIRATRAAYGELFRDPLQQVNASKTRIVIVPDQSMNGLPLNGLGGTADEKYLIERASISIAGSTSLYLYALARDRQFANDRNPPVLLVGNPASGKPLPAAEAEVKELAQNDYPGAELLIGAAATVDRFLAKARNAGIIHFAGHGIANPEVPWQSRLLFASGDLNAARLLTELSRFERTRLMVLGACESAGGGPVGPQGLAPLFRPIIGARVPAVVGALWKVEDASAKELLVSFHCHYRHGDDVAVALRMAQLEQIARLRKKEPALNAMQWAAFQVAGYAASPYPRSIALENQSREHVCTQNSLHRPDGLHPQ